MKAPDLQTLKNLCFKQNLDPSLRERYRRSYAVYYALIVTHWISIRVVWLLVRTPITPNQVSLVSYLAGWAGAWFLATPGRWNFLIGALLFEVFYILDAVDGQLARAKGLSSAAGAYLDDWANFIVPPVIVAALGLRIQPALGPVCAVSAAFTVISIPAIHVLEARFAAKAGIQAQPPSLAPVRSNPVKAAYSFFYRACTMPVIMNLITLSALSQMVLGLGGFDPAVALIAFWGVVGVPIWISQGVASWRRLGGKISTPLVRAGVLAAIVLSVAVAVAAPGRSRVWAAKSYCWLAGHEWTGYFSDDWRWHYNRGGSNFPLGYKYRYLDNSVRCARCGSSLFDKPVVEDTVEPLLESDLSAAAGQTPSIPTRWSWAWNGSDGPVETSAQGGASRSQWWFRRGRLHGPGRDFYPDGRVRAEWTAIHDELEGPARGYHPNGVRLWQEVYHRGAPTGESAEYYADGTVKHRYQYRDGMLEGPSEQYYPDGRLRRRETYRHGRVEGLRQDYRPDGTLHTEKMFAGGVEVSRKEWP